MLGDGRPRHAPPTLAGQYLEISQARVFERLDEATESERFVEERKQGKRPGEALAATVTGTGAALFGSAVTTAGGFGVLALTILPMLRQFGLVTALTVVYAFLAAVLVLPSLLVLWDRWLGLTTAESRADRAVGQPTVGDD